MIRFLIASHGYLADGFRSTLKVIMGEEIANKIDTINAFVHDENENVKGIIEDYIKNVSVDDKLIVFTDLMHGSVNQFLIPLVDDKKVYVIAGVNFPMICEVIARYSFTDETEVHMNDLLEIIEKSKDEMILVNERVNQEPLETNEDDFFG